VSGLSNCVAIRLKCLIFFKDSFDEIALLVDAALKVSGSTSAAV